MTKENEKKEDKKLEDVTDKGSPNLPKETEKLEDVFPVTAEEAFKSEDEALVSEVDVEKELIENEAQGPGPDPEPVKDPFPNQEFIDDADPIETETESVANKDLVNEIICFRLEIDKLYQLASRFFIKNNNLMNSIFLAKCWAGKLLGETGHKNPYKVNKEIKKPTDIPETANVYYLSFHDRQNFDNLSVIDRVLFLRDELGVLIKDLDLIDFKESVDDVRKASIAVTQAYVNLSRASFELGNELAKIREQ